MGARVLVIISLATVAAYAQPIEISQNQNGNRNFVPGVFISTEALKNLQDKAQQNQNPPITNQGGQPITNSGITASSQNDEPKIGSAYTTSQAAPVDTRNQPNIIATLPNQVVLPQSQPQIVTVPNQPSNQAIMLAQPGNQAILIQQPGYNQPQPLYVNQPNGNQFVSQPNQQVVLPNGQIAQIVTNGQPIINNGQPFVTNGQPFINNGQPVYINGNQLNNGQPLLVTNPGNQVTLLQGTPNTMQNPSTGVQYAVVPNSPPNTNLGNSNTYVMVPSNTNQVYTVSNG